MDSQITTIILTFIEELHIERAIKSAKKISNQIFIVDSYSNDETLNICKKYQVEIIQNKFIKQAKQFNWPLNKLSIKRNCSESAGSEPNSPLGHLIENSTAFSKSFLIK